MECGLSPGTVSALQGARGTAVVSRRLIYTRPAPTAPQSHLHPQGWLPVSPHTAQGQ